MTTALSTLRTSVADAIGNSQTISTRQTDLALNYAHLLAALYFDPPEMRIETDVILSSSATSVSLSALTRPRVIDVIYNYTSSRRMHSLPWDRWYLLKPGGAGNALYYCHYNATLYTDPTPAANNTLNVFYKKYPAALSSAGDTLDFDYHDSWIVMTATKFVWAMQEENEAVDMITKVGDAIGIPLAMGTQLRHDFEEGIRGQYNVQGTKA